MYKLKKNKLYYKSDQITTSKFDVGMTSLFRRRDLNTTYIQR